MIELSAQEKNGSEHCMNSTLFARVLSSNLNVQLIMFYASWFREPIYGLQMMFGCLMACTAREPTAFAIDIAKLCYK